MDGDAPIIAAAVLAAAPAADIPESSDILPAITGRVASNVLAARDWYGRIAAVLVNKSSSRTNENLHSLETSDLFPWVLEYSIQCHPKNPI